MKHVNAIIRILLVSILFSSCGFMLEPKKYNCTISGTIYSNRESKEPISNLAIYITDTETDTLSYGMSYLDREYTTYTDENGHFSIDISSEKIHTEIYASTRINIDGTPYTKDYYCDTDSSLCQSYVFHIEASKYRASKFKDLQIYMSEEGHVSVEPCQFTRNQAIEITLPYGVQKFYNYRLKEVVATETEEYIYPCSLSHKVVYCPSASEDNPISYTNEPIRIDLAIPDSIPAGIYSLVATVQNGWGVVSSSARWDCIIELIDE